MTFSKVLVSGPAAAMSPEKLLEMQFLSPTLDPQIQKLWRRTPEIHVLISLLGDSDVHSIWEPLLKDNMAGMKQAKTNSQMI